MRSLSLWVLAIMYLACWNKLSANEEYKEDMDSLLHRVTGHRQGVVVEDNEGLKMRVYMSCISKASNGISYYRWWDGNFLYAIHDPVELANDDRAKPMTYGYRNDDEKMYVYNYEKEEESVAYDFTLQPGEQFTTPDGVCWEVIKRRTEVFESLLDENLIDYKNEHVVLNVLSSDGTMTDEWVQYIGALHYPIQVWGRSDIKRSHTAFFNFGDSDDKLLYFNFSEDPIYGQYVMVVSGPDAHTELNRNYSITTGEESIDVSINYYTWLTRHYCYTYRINDTFDIQSLELGPYLDGGDLSSALLGLTFPDAPSFDNYNVIFNGEMLSTSIATPQESDQNRSTYDLSGRKVSKPKSGVYIKDRKKVILR